MQKSIGRAGWIFLLIAVVSVSGCGRSSVSNSSAPGAASGNGGPSAAPSAAKPGYIIGKITRPDGSPIGVVGVKYTVNVFGVAGMGNNVSYSPQVDADGNFSSPLASGIYHQVNASISVPFNGTVFAYQLVPTTMTGDMQSDAGIVSDFVWQISGPVFTVKDNPDPANYTHWVGGCCGLEWDDVYKDAAGASHDFNIPVGAQMDFTATPQGKQIDGNDAKTLTWHGKWLALGLTPTVLNDMPMTTGGWAITGQETNPDGKTNPILFEGPGYVGRTTSTTIQFKPNGYATPGLWPVPVAVTDPAP